MRSKNTLKKWTTLMNHPYEPPLSIK
jgi:hypothetical protein